MAQEKNNIIEYKSDYRDYTDRTNKVTPITHVQPKCQTNYTSTIKNNDHRTATTAKAKTTKNTYSKIKIPPKTKEVNDIQSGCIKPTQKSKKQIKFYRILFACITMVLSCTGIVILLSAMNRTTSVIDDSSRFTKYNNYIAPVVMHNPDSFNETQKANMDIVISSSIWRSIFQNGIEKYNEFDEQGLILIPVTDIQTACTDLFGPDYTINTQENIYGPFFSYTPGESYFHIGAISNLGTYVPNIEEITEEGSYLSLKVAYLSRDDKYLNDNQDKSEPPHPVKYMRYKLKINSETNKYYIYSIENI